MIRTVVVGHGLAGRSFHCPLVRRQPGLTLHGIVARDPQVRDEAVALWGEGVRGYAGLDEALADPAVELVVIATPHDSHAELAVRTLEAGAALRGGQGHGAVDRGGRPDDRRPRPIGPDAVGLPQSPLGLGFRDRQAGARARLDRPAPALRELRLPRRGPAKLARQHRGRRHDPARLGRAPGRPGAPARPRPVPAARRLADAGSLGGRRQRRPRADRHWSSTTSCFRSRPAGSAGSTGPGGGSSGSEGGFVKFGVDPQEDALRAGDIDAAAEPAQLEGILRRAGEAERSWRAGCRRSAPTGTRSTATSPSISPAVRRWRSPPSRPARSCACSRPRPPRLASTP